jgi:hypothetical protein
MRHLPSQGIDLACYAPLASLTCCRSMARHTPGAAPWEAEYGHVRSALSYTIPNIDWCSERIYNHLSPSAILDSYHAVRFEIMSTFLSSPTTHGSTEQEADIYPHCGRHKGVKEPAQVCWSLTFISAVALTHQN